MNKFGKKKTNQGFRPMAEKPAREENRYKASTEVRPRQSVVFGVLPVLEVLRASSRKVDRVVIVDGVREHRLSEIIEIAKSNGILIDRVTKEHMSRLTGKDANNQGVAVYVAAANYAVADDLISDLDETSIVVILDGIEDPRNLGAILRTVECAGISAVFIPERRAVGLTETVAKASAGAIEYTRVAKVANLNRLIEELKGKKIWVVGTSSDAQMDYTEWDWTQPSALVLGSEGGGLHRLVSENCDVLVKIPMHGKVDSLNVSVAAGVILFEARRQRSQKAGK